MGGFKQKGDIAGAVNAVSGSEGESGAGTGHCRHPGGSRRWPGWEEGGGSWRGGVGGGADGLADAKDVGVETGDCWTPPRFLARSEDLGRGGEVAGRTGLGWKIQRTERDLTVTGPWAIWWECRLRGSPGTWRPRIGPGQVQIPARHTLAVSLGLVFKLERVKTSSFLDCYEE